MNFLEECVNVSLPRSYERTPQMLRGTRLHGVVESKTSSPSNLPASAPGGALRATFRWSWIHCKVLARHVRNRAGATTSPLATDTASSCAHQAPGLAACLCQPMGSRRSLVDLEGPRVALSIFPTMGGGRGIAPLRSAYSSVSGPQRASSSRFPGILAVQCWQTYAMLMGVPTECRHGAVKMLQRECVGSARLALTVGFRGCVIGPRRLQWIGVVSLAHFAVFPYFHQYC